MSPRIRRMLVQLGLIAAYVAASLLFIGWQCGGYSNDPPINTGSGSDHKKQGGGTSRDRAVTEHPGQITRYHDITIGSGQTYNAKDVEFFRTWAAEDWFVAVQVPTAPGASQPGVLISDTVEPNSFTYVPDYSNWFTAPLITDTRAAVQVAALIPPDTGTQWQALRPKDYTFLSKLPTQATTLNNEYLMLTYHLDFKGADYCNHCAMKLTFCMRSQPLSLQRLVFRGLMDNQVLADGVMACRTPQENYIALTEFVDIQHPQVPLPGPVVAAFGLWGGMAVTETRSSQVILPYGLQHTAASTQLLDLAPAYSSRGYTYVWADQSGVPLPTRRVQVDAPAPGQGFGRLELKLLGQNLPTCVSLQDTVYLTATMVTTPSIQATTFTHVNLLPDPAHCNVVDVGVQQVASQQVVSPTVWVTYTMTVHNYSNASQTINISNTFSTATALQALRLPAGCQQAGSRFTCDPLNLAAGASTQLTFAAQIHSAFQGLLESLASVLPANALDDRMYDNISQTYINVIGAPQPESRIYAPYLRRR